MLGLFVIAFGSLVLCVVAGLASQGGGGSAQVAQAGPPAAPARVARAITVEWVGDMALSSGLGLPPGGVAGALAPLGSRLRDADITAGNLEGTLSVGGVSKCGGANTITCLSERWSGLRQVARRHRQARGSRMAGSVAPRLAQQRPGCANRTAQVYRADPNAPASLYPWRFKWPGGGARFHVFRLSGSSG